MARRFALLLRFMFLVMVPVHSGFCFQWPVDNPTITATFGENRWNHFHGGIDIGGGEQEIFPIEDGEVVFYFEEDEDTSGIPTGLGNFLVVEHERGIRSLYAHMKKGTVDHEKRLVSKEDTIGIIGETGGALGKHLHFEVSDREFRQLVNPMHLLPKLEDAVAPTIGVVQIVRLDDKGEMAGERIDLVPGLRVMPGRWAVLLEVYDISTKLDYRYPMAPYRVQVYLNGRDAISIVYDGLGESDGILVLKQSGGVPFASFYLDEWLFNAGQITIPEGEVQMEIIAGDYVGNESSKRVALAAARP